MPQEQYKSISEMVSSIPLEKDLENEIVEHISRRQIVKNLITTRIKCDMSQSDIAAKMKCSQSRISKLENGFDDDLDLGTLQSYANAIQFELQLMFLPKKRTVLDEIKFFAFRIKDRLDYLAKLAHKDEKIAGGVTRSFGNLLFNFVSMIHDCAQSLPAKSPSEGIVVESMASDQDAESHEQDALSV